MANDHDSESVVEVGVLVAIEIDYLRTMALDDEDGVRRLLLK
jgi:hypothetical protein